MDQLHRAGPVRGGERIEVIDILRGFAVLGILVANMASYSGMSRDPQAWSEPIDRVILLLTRFLVEAKFYSLFSFLFGWGMSVQMARAGVRGGNFVSLYLRRLLILLAFGLLHAVFLWRGDILSIYALLGFLLLLFRKRSPATILIASGLALLLPIALSLPGEIMDAFRTWYEQATSLLRSNTYPSSLYATGSYWEITRLRIQDYLAANSWFIYWTGNIFAMFLLGLYVGKRRIFQELDQRLTLVRVVLVVGLVVGVVFNGIYVLSVARPGLIPPEYQSLAGRGARTIGAPALMLFYVSAIVLLVRREEWYRRLAPLSSVGRSALSNYLLQSVGCTLLFYGYGLGLYGQIDPLLGLILTVLLFLAQVQVSGWWFARYRFGPMEWLWRTLTYGRIQPLQRRDAPEGLTPTLGRRVRLTAAKVPPRRVLAVVWIGLLVWAAALVLWNLRLQRALPQAPVPMPRTEARTTAAPGTVQGGSQVVDSSPQEQVEILATPVVQPVAYDPGPLAASGDLWALASAFDTESALDQIDTLTGPPYLGRYTGSPEAWAAGDYIADQFARYGLQPAGEAGTFFQSFPVEYIALTGDPSLAVEEADGTVHSGYEAFRDFSPIVRWYSGPGVAEGEVVWANECAVDDFAQVDAPGKIVLCRSQDIQQAERGALEHGAAGLLLLTDPEQRLPDFGNTYFEPWVPEPMPAFRVYPSAVDELMLGSGKTVEDLSTTFAPFALETRARMEVEITGAEACPVQECLGRNVLGVLPGRDPEYADQVIILGAHYDHIGQAPNGIVWPGANDDASGVAVLLEIARTWYEQGYVPRHTVLFAAWDAEEVGLVGASHYVQQPRYPLEDTLAMIQLDMVGAGNETLWIDGGGELGEHLSTVAQALGVVTDHTDHGRSDHVPFMMAGVPANLLIWRYDQGEPEYHRPVDGPENIELDKLETAGQIVGLTILGLTEGEPAINELLARRASAVEQGDLAAFLDTSHSEQEAIDRFWFEDLQALASDRVEMQATAVRILGPTARATVQMTVHFPDDRQNGFDAPQTASLAVQFVHDGQDWRWAGPDLDWMEGESGFAVAHPPGTEVGLGGLGEAAAGQYAAMAERLGLPTDPESALLLFPDTGSLRASTALSLPAGQDQWVGPGTIKLTYSPGISASLQLTDTLAQLLLAQAGVTEEAAPWLWQGLPLALGVSANAVDAQVQFLPALQRALDEKTVVLTEEASWAAVDYMRQQIGWQGIGRFITTLGQACHGGLCTGQEGLDQALADVLGMDSPAFEAAWQQAWRERLTTAQAGLDAVLAARTAAILTGDEAAFLETVDPGVPNLLSEEKHWFADLVHESPEEISLTGYPLALLANGGILAQVTENIHFPESAGRQSETRVVLRVQFTEENGQVRWAGHPFRSLSQGRVQVLYPQGWNEAARALAEEVEAAYDQLNSNLSLNAREALTIKLYENDDAFRASISPTFAPGNRAQIWSRPGESVKLHWPPNASLEDLRPGLAVQLARHLLAEIGVDSEWLLKGTSLYLSELLDGGRSVQAATQKLHKVLQAIPKDGIYDLETMPPDHELAVGELSLIQAQAWDTIRYLEYAYGWDAVVDLLQGQAQGLGLSAALERATGQTLPEFEAAWAESLARGHMPLEWIEIANTFDVQRVEEHIEHLASPQLAGRQAGSAGAEAAALYIAEQFAQAGLRPIIGQGPDGDGATGFFQTLPITHTVLLSAPQLEIVDGPGGTQVAFGYREHFILPAETAANGGLASGELVWIQDGDYQGLDLAGKIAVRRPATSFDAEAARAAEHGASGLLLVGEKESSKQLLAKRPLPPDLPAEPTIPVLELTQVGFERLLESIGQADPRNLEDRPALPLGLQARIQVPIGSPQAVETANVLGFLPGSDPELSQEVIILGAHYDHVGDDPDAMVCTVESSTSSGHAPSTTCERVEGRRYAGANDNASGIGVLLEIAHLWQESGYHPQRSVLFAAWGAQEAGQLGSSYYVAHPALPLEQTIAMLQLDAVGGGRGYYLEAQGGGEREGLILFDLMVAEEWVDGRLSIRAKWGESDQIPFRDASVPSLLLTWRDASEDNWPVEIADTVEPYRLGITGRMVSLALMALAR